MRFMVIGGLDVESRKGAMREYREPWLKLPDKGPGREEAPRVDPRFRTHVVMARATAVAPTSLSAPVPSRPRPEPPGQGPVLAVPTVGGAPTASAIEHAAAAAALSRRAAPRPVTPQRAEQPPIAVPRPSQARAPSATEVGLEDLAVVSSADWLAKVGEAAKMVDVVVVFYRAAYQEAAAFQRAFRTVVNDMLPHLGRPYAVYRFSLDAEPGFVKEMAESLGLAEGDPITGAGFAWSGPGRRLFLVGDRALDSQAAFQRTLRRNLTGERAPVLGENGARHAQIMDVERSRSRRGSSRAPIWGGRALVILAWCLFGTAALGAVVVGVAPQWASSLLHPTSLPGSGASANDPAAASKAQSMANPPAAGPDNAAAAPLADAVQEPIKPANQVKHAKRKHTPSSLSLNPSYWGLPEKSAR